jgi:hypothetical protein
LLAQFFDMSLYAQGNVFVGNLPGYFNQNRLEAPRILRTFAVQVLLIAFLQIIGVSSIEGIIITPKYVNPIKHEINLQESNELRASLSVNLMRCPSYEVIHAKSKRHKGKSKVVE